LYQYSIRHDVAVEARQVVTLLLSTFVVGGYFTTVGRTGRADYLPGIFYWMKTFWIS
jgi:hypothetical protein